MSNSSTIEFVPTIKYDGDGQVHTTDEILSELKEYSNIHIPSKWSITKELIEKINKYPTIVQQPDYQDDNYRVDFEEIVDGVMGDLFIWKDFGEDSIRVPKYDTSGNIYSDKSHNKMYQIHLLEKEED